jgi:hypothetical protein
MRALVLIPFVGFLAAPLAAQEWRDELRSDLVTMQGAKMVIEESGLVTITLPDYEPSKFQAKLHSEAPVGGVISRDNFVAVTTMMETMLLLTAFAEAYQVPASQFVQGWDFTELEAPIGTPDLEVNLVMTGDGMQFEVVNTSTGERSRETMTWAEVYGK